MGLADWKRHSEEMAARYPGMYVQHFPGMLLDDEVALVTPEDYGRILQLPVYDASVPTGVYLGKMWLCRGRLVVYEQDPECPETHASTRSRVVLVVE